MKKSIIIIFLAAIASTSFSQVHWGRYLNGAGGDRLNDPTSVYVSGNYAYVLNHFGQSLQIIDISNSMAPLYKGYISHGSGEAELSLGECVFVQGNYAYVGSGTYLEVVDVSNPSAPIHAGKYTPGTSSTAMQGVNAIVVQGNYAYMSSDLYSTLDIVDVSNPAKPFLVSSVRYDNLGVGGNGISVSGSYAYITGISGMAVVDVSTPSSQKLKGYLLDGSGSASLNNSMGISVSGGYAYVAAAGSNALEVVNISSPTAPTHAGKILNGTSGAVLANPQAIVVAGGYAYVGSNSTLEIVNVGTPSSPSHVSSLADATGATIYRNDLFFDATHNLVYLGMTYTTATGAFEIIDVSTASSPVQKGLLNNVLNGAYVVYPSAITTSGQYAYVTSQYSGSSYLEIIDISNPATPYHAGNLFDGGSWPGPSYPTAIAVQNNLAYLTCGGTYALEIIDVSTPGSPVHKGNITNGTGGALLSYPVSLAVVGSYVFVASSGSNAIEVINASNPASPQHATSIVNGQGNAILANPRSICVVGSYAYVVGSTALEIINISTPMSPYHVGSVTAGISSPTCVSVSGNYAYVTNNSSFDVYDVSTPSNPLHVASVPNGTVSLTLPLAVATSGNYAYVTCQNSKGTFYAFDISTPTNPVLKATLTEGTLGPYLNDPYALNVNGNYVYVTSGADNGIEVIRLPMTPVVTFTSPSAGTYGQSITLAVNEGGSTGAVTYSVVNGTGSATLSNGVLQLTMPGTVTVTANVAAADIYNAASVSQTITISKASQTITFNALPQRCGVGTLALTASASSALPVSYTSSNTSVATVSGSTLTIVGAGTSQITASQAGNTYYLAATNVVQTMTVNSPPTISISSSNGNNICTTGSTVLTVNGFGTATISWSSSGGDYSGSNRTLPVFDPETYYVTATGGGCTSTAQITIVRNGTNCHGLLRVAAPSPREEVDSPEVTEFTAFPNPASDKLTLAVPWNAKEDTPIYFYDMFGRVAGTATLRKGEWKTELLVNNYVDGLYIARVGNDDMTSTIKVVVMHK